MTTAALVTRDYQGAPFVFREDGFFNMTKAAKHFGKRLDNFWRLKEVRDYMEALCQAICEEHPSHPRDVLSAGGAMDILTGRSWITAAYGGGTWAHPKLAVFFARWLDVRFAVWCDMVIDDILHKKAEVVITKPQESAVLVLPESYSGAMLELSSALVARAEAIKDRDKDISAHPQAAPRSMTNGIARAALVAPFRGTGG